MANENWLTDANDVPKLFEKKYEETQQRIIDGETYLDTLAEGFTEADDVIQAMPTVDAVEVVRCKDCIYAKNNYLVHGLCLCEKPMHHVVYGDRPKNALMCEDDFCSYGERREGE